ncbi:GH36-type glycosyl hydrolase domain-containing protein [Marinitoga aeolica]|uniref:Glycosyl transferase family 36 n=1 Tax=Marinitoga aeolica TaxID=2809031 RepID=A0ABY8PPN5_9BACT|nr:glycosyl transferase family 36 [Marinitoga aeolica]WGS64611.1 glycosyl transferase family 36 [Marinitoga aeolica]
MKKYFESKYGYFTDDEYVITNPKTPKPWVNVISNGDYSIIVSQNGSGYSWRGNGSENRITRSFQDLIKDNWGKYFYLRDLETKEYWSLGLKPVMHDYDFYEVKHGFGYSIIKQVKNNIETELKFFVSIDNPVEFMEIKITNKTDKKKNFDLSSYVEWVLGNFPDEHREFHKIFVDSKFENNALYYDKLISSFLDEKGRHNNKSWDQIAFHAVSEKVKSYEGDKENFIGMYRTEANPIAMEEDVLSQKTGRYTDPIGSLQVEFELNPNESKTIVYIIGTAYKGKEDPKEFVKAFANVEASEKEFKKVVKFWNELFDKEHVETPDDAFNLMTNKWLKYQAISGRMWAKSGYYQVSGGYGYRDQLQDSLIFLPLDPSYTKKQLLLHAEHQFKEGDVLHWWLTIGNWGPRTKCSDDLLWLPFIANYYIMETGDYSILDEVVPYYDGGKDTFYNHCKKAIEKVFSRFSPRGIPLMGDNDWNDGLSAVGTDWKGESFWVAEFLYFILKEFKKFAEYKKDKKFIEKIDDVLENLKEAFNKYGWDGEWFLQATTDDFEKVGSKDNEEGKIYLNPQLWAVISGITNEERIKKSMYSVTKYLLKDYGALLLAPAYTEPKTDIGYITRYAPGLRENGGVYTHAATWAVWAYALLKDNEKAYEAYKKICPPNRVKDIDNYLAEPYVTPGNTDGPLSPYYGRGGWTWYTGSAQWLHRVGTNYILGIRPTLDGLEINPCVPKDWNGFKYKRTFRNSTYLIEVINNGCNIKEIYVDGKKIDSNIIPSFEDNKEHNIKVILN